MTAPDLGFAIVGTGVAGHYHATAIAQTAGARLVAVCRADAARAGECAAQFGAPCEPNLATLLARPDVDVVCIATPSGLHAQQALAAARARKHLLVEKPMALTLADADALIAECHHSGVLLGVMLQRRTDPTFRAVRAGIEQGALGRLVSGLISIPYLRPQSYYDSASWRGTWALDGGGVLMNQGIHLIDLLLWFMGDVAEVCARADTLAHAIDVEDCLAATLRFASGALGTITATTAAAPGFPHRVEVYGTGGGVQIEGEQVTRWESASNQTPSPVVTVPQRVDAGAGASPTGISAIGHTRLVSDMVSAVHEGREPLVSGAEARRSLALALAVYAAARAGK